MCGGVFLSPTKLKKTKMDTTRKRKRSPPSISSSPDTERSTPESNRPQVPSSKTRRSTAKNQRHTDAADDKLTNPNSTVLWAYLFSAKSEKVFLDHLHTLLDSHIREDNKGMNGHIYINTLSVPIRGMKGKNVSLSCIFKRSNGRFADRIDREFASSYICYRHLHPYWPLFVEPYLLINAKYNTITTSYDIKTIHAFNTKYDHENIIFVGACISNALTLWDWERNFKNNHPLVFNEINKLMLFCLKDMDGLFENADFHSRNVILDTLGNNYHDTPDHWKHVKYVFSNPRTISTPQEFILPMRLYFIDLARTSFAESLLTLTSMKHLCQETEISEFDDIHIAILSNIVDLHQTYVQPYQESIRSEPIPNHYRTIPYRQFTDKGENI